MGETGCGKTRLIRYMCNLQAFGSGHDTMLMMKVIFSHVIMLAMILLFTIVGVRFMEVLRSKILNVKLRKLKN